MQKTEPIREIISSLFIISFRTPWIILQQICYSSHGSSLPLALAILIGCWLSCKQYIYIFLLSGQDLVGLRSKQFWLCPRDFWICFSSWLHRVDSCYHGWIEPKQITCLHFLRCSYGQISSSKLMPPERTQVWLTCWVLSRWNMPVLMYVSLDKITCCVSIDGRINANIGLWLLIKWSWFHHEHAQVISW